MTLIYILFRKTRKFVSYIYIGIEFPRLRKFYIYSVIVSLNGDSEGHRLRLFAWQTAVNLVARTLGNHPKSALCSMDLFKSQLSHGMPNLRGTNLDEWHELGGNLGGGKIFRLSLTARMHKKTLQSSPLPDRESETPGCAHSAPSPACR